MRWNLDYEEVVIRLSRLKKLEVSFVELINKIISLGKIDKDAVELLEEHKKKNP